MRSQPGLTAPCELLKVKYKYPVLNRRGKIRMVEFVDAIAEAALNDWAVIKSYLGEGYMVLNSKYYLVTGPIMTINEASRTIVKLKDTEFNQANDWKIIKSHPKGHRHHLRLKYNATGMPIEPWDEHWDRLTL